MFRSRIIHIILLLVISSSFRFVLGETRTEECEALQSNCQDCLFADCAFAAGACFESCNVIADVTCYTLATDNISASPVELNESMKKDAAEELCFEERKEQEDSDLCVSRGTNCTECLLASKDLSIESNTCLWSDDDFGGSCCSAYSCGWFVSGVTTCDGKTKPPAASSCDSASNCKECLSISSDDCVWTANLCSEECYQDTFCYKTTPSTSEEAIEEMCLHEQNERENEKLCDSKTNCLDCVMTTLPSSSSDDGNKDGLKRTCLWFDADGYNDNDNGGFCQSICGEPCGSATCSSHNDDEKLCNRKTNCFDCVMTTLPSSDDNKTCLWLNDFCHSTCSGSESETATTCISSTCSAASSCDTWNACNECLEGDCVWSNEDGGGCLESCSMIEKDVNNCYSTKDFPEKDSKEICNMVTGFSSSPTAASPITASPITLSSAPTSSAFHRSTTTTLLFILVLVSVA